MLVHRWLTFIVPPAYCLQQGEGDVQEAEEKTYRLDSGLDLVVSRSRTGLQQVANLLLATNRMKKLSKLCSEAQICDSILDHVVQGGHRTPHLPPPNHPYGFLLTPVPFLFLPTTETVLESRVAATAAQPHVYFRVQSGDFCHLLDHSQKAVVKAKAGMSLQAITLKGGNEEHRGERAASVRRTDTRRPFLKTKELNFDP